MFWWVLRALQKDCIAPTTDLHCEFKGRDVYANCHRFDQSAINIAAANYFSYNNMAYVRSNVSTTERGSRHKESIRLCPSGSMQLTKGFLQ